MKGKIMVKVVEVVRRSIPPRPSKAGFQTETEDVTFRHVESTSEECTQFSTRGWEGRYFVSSDDGEFTVRLVDPDLLGVFKVDDRVDLALGLTTPENT